MRGLPMRGCWKTVVTLRREQWKGGNKHVSRGSAVTWVRTRATRIYPRGHIREVTPLMGAIECAERTWTSLPEATCVSLITACNIETERKSIGQDSPQ